MDDYADILRGVQETNEKIGSLLERMNTAPLDTSIQTSTPVSTVGDVPQTNFRRGSLSPEERVYMSSELSRKSDAEISMLVSSAMRKRDAGIPLDHWLAAGGYTLQNALGEMQSNHLDLDVAKAIDTSGVSVLIRQDLEPLLYQVFIRQFPFYDRMGKEPANGLIHAFNRVTAYGTASFMPELGTVTDDKSTYERASTNIAILATRRGVTLKSQFAVAAGGMAWSPEAIEMQGGLRAIAHKMQQTIFGGQASDSGGTNSNELGLYDADGFTGLRSILNSGRVKNVDPATAPTAAGNVRRAVDAALLEAIQTGATGPWEIWSHPSEKVTFDEQQDTNVRILEASQRGASIGVVTQAVNTLAGQIGWNIVPGDSISSYTATTYSSNVVRDVYMVDPNGMSLPFLGTPGPTVLEIPVGISGQLTRLFIIFMMNGLAVKVPQFSNKIRVKV
jgi:hypothetical protein